MPYGASSLSSAAVGASNENKLTNNPSPIRPKAPSHASPAVARNTADPMSTWERRREQYTGTWCYSVSAEDGTLIARIVVSATVQRDIPGSVLVIAMVSSDITWAQRVIHHGL